MLLNLNFFKKYTKLIKEIKKLDNEDFNSINNFIVEIINMTNETYSETYIIEESWFINNKKRKDWVPPYLINMISMYWRFLDSNKRINYHIFPELWSEISLWPSKEEFLFLIDFLNKNIKELKFSIYENKKENEIWYFVTKR